jgi:hypothetical protein
MVNLGFTFMEAPEAVLIRDNDGCSIQKNIELFCLISAGVVEVPHMRVLTITPPGI